MLLACGKAGVGNKGKRFVEVVLEQVVALSRSIEPRRRYQVRIIHGRVEANIKNAKCTFVSDACLHENLVDEFAVIGG